jgi:hypothetical protein
MSSEETARSVGGPFPMNSTLRSVWETDRYSPLDSAELRLAPSAAVGGEENVKRCFRY